MYFRSHNTKLIWESDLAFVDKYVLEKDEKVIFED